MQNVRNQSEVRSPAFRGQDFGIAAISRSCNVVPPKGGIPNLFPAPAHWPLTIFIYANREICAGYAKIGAALASRFTASGSCAYHGVLARRSPQSGAARQAAYWCQGQSCPEYLCQSYSVCSERRLFKVSARSKP